MLHCNKLFLQILVYTQYASDLCFEPLIAACAQSKSQVSQELDKHKDRASC